MDYIAMNKRRVLLVVLFVAILGLAGFAMVILTNDHNNKSTTSPQKVVVQHDKDTGENIFNYPNIEPEAGGKQSYVLLNSGELYSRVNSDQFTPLVNQVGDIIKNKTGKYPKIAKILPGTVKWGSDNNLHAIVKQDSPALQFNITIKLVGPGLVTASAD